MAPCAIRRSEPGLFGRRELLAVFAALAGWSALYLLPVRAADLSVNERLSHRPVTPPELRPQNPSASYIFGNDYIRGLEGLPANAALKWIEERLAGLKYAPLSFFRVHDGVALAAPFERVHDNGLVWNDERFDPEKPVVWDKWWFGTRLVYPRRARSFLFVVTADSVFRGKNPTNYAKHKQTLAAGLPTLEADADLPVITARHHIITYVYEYYDDRNGVLTFVPESALSGERHLQRAGIIP